jgi:hypothetical protein
VRTVVVATRKVCVLPEFAGNTWAHLQWVLGLQRLGVRVVWVDYVNKLNPQAHPHTLDYVVRTFGRLAQDFGFAGNWAIVFGDDGKQVFGMTPADLNEVAKDADLLINISKTVPMSSPLHSIPRRVYVDLDPAFTQIWVRDGDIDIHSFHHHFTVGQNVSRPDYVVPTNGVRWHPVFPPVVLDEWPVRNGSACERISTIGDWRGKQKVIFDGRYFAGKRKEFVKVLGLPALSKQKFELALCVGQGDHEDLGVLEAQGWIVLDPFLWAGNPHSYREFIQTSRAEFSVAKSGYVSLAPGWMSDRTACYLASGKPALVQTTGLERVMPTGSGLVTFSNLEQAVAGLEAINSDYQSHCRAARGLAEQYLDSNRVLGTFLDVCDSASPSRTISSRAL